jgi:hypothetical protein
MTRPRVHRVFPACRHADGTISSSTVVDVRRMASEDSDQLGPGFLAIHRLSDLRNVRQPLRGEMAVRGDELDAAGELQEVLLLRRSQGVPTEERNDPLDQIRPPPDHIAIQVLVMVVVPPIGDHLAHLEEALQFVQARHALRALRDNELMSHLVAGLVSAWAPSAGLADKTDREASFSVYKTNNPT